MIYIQHNLHLVNINFNDQSIDLSLFFITETDFFPVVVKFHFPFQRFCQGFPFQVYLLRLEGSRSNGLILNLWISPLSLDITTKYGSFSNCGYI